MKINKIITVSVLSTAVFVASCKKDKGEEQELITTVKLELTNKADAADKITIQWKDADGPGGNNPVADSLLLKEGVAYSGKIMVWNESANPVEDLTTEIEEKKDIHQFFYYPDGDISGVVEVVKTDKDGNNPPLPVGLSYEVTVKNQSADKTGNLQVVLSHYDEVAKSADRSPESDIDIQFPVRIR